MTNENTEKLTRLAIEAENAFKAGDLKTAKANAMDIYLALYANFEEEKASKLAENEKSIECLASLSPSFAPRLKEAREHKANLLKEVYKPSTYYWEDKPGYRVTVLYISDSCLVIDRQGKKITRMICNQSDIMSEIIHETEGILE